MPSAPTRRAWQRVRHLRNKYEHALDEYERELQEAPSPALPANDDWLPTNAYLPNCYGATTEVERMVPVFISLPDDYCEDLVLYDMTYDLRRISPILDARELMAASNVYIGGEKESKVIYPFHYTTLKLRPCGINKLEVMIKKFFVEGSKSIHAARYRAVIAHLCLHGKKVSEH